jgi:hypothetical protein|tara:strand:- start:435 stop:611 length:177 start_codon:yes stop_codon:yes gene_type:complete
MKAVKEKILKAMYESVDRMNLHISKGNHQSAEAEKWLQANLRHNFTYATRKEHNGKQH